MKYDFRRVVEFKYSLPDDPIGVHLIVPTPTNAAELDLLEEWFVLVMRTLRHQSEGQAEGR